MIINTIIVEKKKLSDSGLAFRKIDVIYFIIGIFIAIVLNVIIIGIISVKGGTNLFPQLFIKFSQSGRNIFSFMGIPLTEELIYRGYILNNTFPKLKFIHRSILSSLLFSIPHWSNADNLSFEFFIFTFIFGTFVFELHWFYNFVVATLFMNTSNYNLTVITTFIFLVIGLFVLKKLNI